MPDAMDATTFDQMAADYDRVATSRLGVLLRERVWQVIDRHLDPSMVVTDIGCGTGIDAEWLSTRATEVWGFDPSPAMLEIANVRCRPTVPLEPEAYRTGEARKPLQLARMEFRCAAAETAELAGTIGKQPDLILANFGVVNCVGDLAAFGQRLAANVAPGGTVVLVSMTRWCPIELGLGLATANRQLVQRRSTSKKNDPAYADLDLRYASATELAKRFAPHLELISAQALGTVLPPFEQRSWVENRPGLLRRLASADRRIAAVGASAGIGDHHIAVFKAPGTTRTPGSTGVGR